MLVLNRAPSKVSRLTVVRREAKEEVPRDERTWVFYK